MGFETILFNKQEYIATVNLNRPNRLNAGNEQVVERHNPLALQVGLRQGPQQLVRLLHKERDCRAPEGSKLRVQSSNVGGS